MEGLFVVLLIIFLLSTSSKKNRARVDAQRKGQQAAANAPGQPSPTPVARMTPAERRQRIEALKGKKQSLRAEAQAVRAAAPQAPAAHPGEGLSRPGSLAARAPQGFEGFDEEGCVGGSMPHDHTEGERRDEHARHIAAMAARDAEEAVLAAPRGIAALDPTALRRAVVVSEILGKPRALRRRAG